MARAQFQKGQKVWVECVGAWAQIEKVQPVWAKGFEEPVRVTYDVGLGREFLGHELLLPSEDTHADAGGNWRLMRAKNKWQAIEDCAGHPFPGTYPVVVTDRADWGGWRVPGAEYDRDPDQIEFQARMIVAAPKMKTIVEALVAAVADAPEDAPPAMRELANAARPILKSITEIMAPPPVDASTPGPAAAPAAASAPSHTAAGATLRTHFGAKAA